MTGTDYQFTTFRGTATEAGELFTAIQHACACDWDWSGTQRVCAPHFAYFYEQRFVSGFGFGRYMRDVYLREEGIPQ